MSSRNRPQDFRRITQQGVDFTWQAETSPAGFDRQARALRFTAGSTLGDSRERLLEYRDFLDLWVLGQTSRLFDVAGNIDVESTAFFAATGMPKEKFSFGRLAGNMAYHPDGTLAQLADPAGNTTRFDNFHRGQPQRAAFADGTVATQVIDNLGNATESTSEVGITTRYLFDAMGRVSRIIHPIGCDTTQSFQQVWAGDRGLLPGHWRQTIDTCGAVTERWFDGMWRVRLQYMRDANDPANTGSAVETRFDGGGRKVFQSWPQRNLASVDTVHPGQSWSHDGLNRVLTHTQDSEIGTLTATTSYWGGFQKQTVNPRGFATTFRYQAFDEPSEEHITAIDVPAEGVLLTVQRDQFSKARAIARAGGGLSASRTYAYDVHQRLCKTIEPETGATVQFYDAANNLAWRASGLDLTNPGSCDQSAVPDVRKISFSYDPRNRLTGTGYGDGSLWNGRSYTADGLLAQVWNYRTSWTYAYDANRKLVAEQYTWWPGASPGQGWNFSWQYDGRRNLSSLTDPWGAMAYAPNALGQPTQVSGYASGITWHPNGAVAGYTLNNGVSHTMSLNTRGLPWVKADSGPSTIIHDRYSYDANGNVVGIEDLRTSRPEGVNTTRWMPAAGGYDGLDRLRLVYGPWGTAAYWYDALDNLRVSSVGGRGLTHQYDARNRLVALTGSQNITIGYDANGNVVQRAGQSYNFDIGNRLTSAPGKFNWHVYDGHGRRSQSAPADGNWRLYAYSQAGKLLFSYRTDQGHTRYVYIGDKLISETTEAATTYSHTDALGSPVAKTNSIGDVLFRTRFEPYGATAGGTEPPKIGFTGHVNEPETGLVYMQQRYYDPLAGRFLSVDPVTTDAGNGALFNRYMYAANNPFTLFDPDGRCTGSRITNSDGTCKSTGGFTTGTDGMAQGMQRAQTAQAPAGAANAPGSPYIEPTWKEVGAVADGVATAASITPLGMPVRAAKAVTTIAGATFKTGHYASRLEAAGVNVARAEAAVAKEVGAMRGGMATNADVAGRLTVDGVKVEYRARMLPNGTVNVGTPSEMNMRPLTYEERTLLANFASKLDGGQRKQLLEDLENASAELGTPDGSRVLFAIAGYERPPYLGQHLFPIEGKVLDDDGSELSVLLYADENGRLLELEFIRWDSSDLLGPRWDTLKLQ